MHNCHSHTKRVRYLVSSGLVTVDFEGNVVKGRKKSLSELPMHIEIYKRRLGVQAIIHTHATYATALAVARADLPIIIDESTIKLGGDVNVSEYAVAGTQELARNVADVLGKKNAALITNHGCVIVGRSVEEALENMILLEYTAKIYVISKIIGSPQRLPEDAVTLEIDLFKSTYTTE